jgi:hypothetical protein
MDIRGSGAHRRSGHRRPGQDLTLAMCRSQRPTWGMQTEAMAMGHDGFHCGALTSALRVRPDILSSIGRTPLWHKLNSAFWQALCRHYGRQSSRPVLARSAQGPRCIQPPPFARQAQEMFLCRKPMSTS